MQQLAKCLCLLSSLILSNVLHAQPAEDFNKVIFYNQTDSHVKGYAIEPFAAPIKVSLAAGEHSDQFDIVTPMQGGAITPFWRVAKNVVVKCPSIDTPKLEGKVAKIILMGQSSNYQCTIAEHIPNR